MLYADIGSGARLWKKLSMPRNTAAKKIDNDVISLL